MKAFQGGIGNMIYDINDIRKFLLSKGYIWNGTVFFNGSSMLLRKANEPSFSARVTINYSTFKMQGTAGDFDYSEDWIKFMLSEHPQKSTAETILAFINDEESFLKSRTESDLEKLRKEIAKIQKETTAKNRELDLKKNLVLLHVQHIDDENIQ